MISTEHHLASLLLKEQVLLLSRNRLFDFILFLLHFNMSRSESIQDLLMIDHGLVFGDFTVFLHLETNKSLNFLKSLHIILRDEGD